ncbi:MAG: metal ABC transporter solute-binding protein, Zn/Mn family [Chloroflexota bacterium]|jgi:ABC-type Zn uptake system ZnuABC Zn-binding protein ZnuA
MVKTRLISTLAALLAVAIASSCAASPAPTPIPEANQASTPTATAPGAESVATPTGVAQEATPPGAPEPSPQASANNPSKTALATVSFLADIARNVTGSRFEIDSLVPPDADPHNFEPTPVDAARIADSDLLIVNGAGLEEFLKPLLENSSGQTPVIEAAAGIPSRESHEENGTGDRHEAEKEHHHDADPHFWLDPNHVIKYVENLQKGFSEIDPDGADVYASNAKAYIAKLKELDAWITEQVSQLPPEQRLLVTSHESFGYYADRYGFEVVGAVIPSVGTGASPSAQQMAQLIDQIKTTGAKAIFVETGVNPQLALQIAQETGVKEVTRLYTHSLTDAGGDAATYLEMMGYNTRTIVEALK